jgi:hypothetical protein
MWRNLKMGGIYYQRDTQMVKFIIVVSEVDIIPQLGTQSNRKCEDYKNGDNPDIPLFTLP